MGFTDIQAAILECQATAELAPKTLMSCLRISPAAIVCPNYTGLRQALLHVGATSLRQMCKTLHCSEGFVQQMQREVYERKNRAYGASYKATGAIGVVIRMCDKLSRLCHSYQAAADYDKESIEDTMLDLSIYAILAIECLDA